MVAITDQTMSFPEAVAAGEAAFQRIAGRLSDHLAHGKSAPNRPRCPFRISLKAHAWLVGYNRAHDEFMAQWHDDR
ncbi:hypothetical protein ACGLHS_31785 [Variovorax sp. VaC1]|uniref:hypothetical protein n=1 Tax=Variovorax sp. VaC1 TaxID=3373132 RepID=UPI0037485340